MTVTYQELVAQYKAKFAPETVAKIDELLDDSFALEDILEFIEEKNEVLFVKYYEDYVIAGEDLNYDVVNSFIEEFGLENVSYCQEQYFGQYNSPESFAEEYYTDIIGSSIPEGVIVDWEATWKCNLQYDFVFSDGYIFNKNW